jgi:hypothetical protein
MGTSNIDLIVIKSFLKRKDLLARIKEVEDLVSDNNKRVETSTENTKKHLILPDTLTTGKTRRFNTKTQILQSLGLNLIIKNKKLCFDKQKHFFLIERELKEIEAIKQELEPDILPGKQQKRTL